MKIHVIDQVFNFICSLPVLGIFLTAGRVAMIEKTVSEILSSKSVKNEVGKELTETEKNVVLLEYGTASVCGGISGVLTIAIAIVLIMLEVISLQLGIIFGIAGLAALGLAICQVTRINNYFADSFHSIISSPS